MLSPWVWLIETMQRYLPSTTATAARRLPSLRQCTWCGPQPVYSRAFGVKETPLSEPVLGQLLHLQGVKRRYACCAGRAALRAACHEGTGNIRADSDAADTSQLSGW